MIEIKALRPDDWELTRELRLAALLDAPDAFGGMYEHTLQRPEQEWRQWPAGGQPFAAFMDGKPVGMVCAAAHDDPHRTYLIAMWVSPEARGLGAGPALIDAVAGWARARGSHILELDVYKANEPAYRAYLKAGFTPIGLCPDHPGAVTMHLPIDTPPRE